MCEFDVSGSGDAVEWVRDEAHEADRAMKEVKQCDRSLPSYSKRGAAKRESLIQTTRPSHYSSSAVESS